MGKFKTSKKLPGVVTGGDSRSPVLGNITSSIRTHKKLGLLLLAAVVLLAAGTALYLHNKASKTDELPSFSAEERSTMPVNDYYGMTQDEVAYRVQSVTGYSLATLKSKPLTSGMFKSFDTTMVAARSLARVGAMDQSLAAYGIAAAKIGNTNPQFYIEYASVATENENVALATKQLNKAKQLASQNATTQTDLQPQIDAVAATIQRAKQ